jgi:hypothetical protein
MLLVYTRLFGRDMTFPKSTARPNQLTFSKSETDAEREGSSHLRHTHLTEEIRHIQQVYYLERRLFL